MDLGIKDKVVLITGAGKGLGKAIAESFAEEGSNIIAISKTRSNLENLKTCLSGDKHYFKTIDLEQVGSIKILEKFLERKKKKPDIIINNVGGNLNINDPLCSAHDWRKVFNLNLEIAIEINRLYIPYMKKKKWGRICHISSIAGLENQGAPPYCASKAALNSYIRSVGRYVSSHNVILTGVSPGAILTKGGYWDESMKNRPNHVEKYLEDRMAIKRFGRPEEVSKLVTFMCSEYASFCVGTNVLVDGGQGRVFFEG